MHTGQQGDENSAEAAYEAMAPAYDDFTARNDHGLWIDNLLPKAELHGLGRGGQRLLDVACGTGKSFIPMLERGWEVTACDISPSMVEIARAKVGKKIEVSVADMRQLPVLGEFDLVWSLDDAVNYLLSVAEVEQALTGIRRNLAPGGLAMFDVNTIRAYRTFFAEEVAVDLDGRRLLWRGHASPTQEPGTITEASFEVEPLRPGTGAIPPQLHRQRHFPEAEMLAALEAAGLKCLDVYGHGDDAVPEQPLDESRHTKAVYIAGLPGMAGGGSSQDPIE